MSHWQRLAKDLLVWRASVSLGSWKLNCSWQHFITSMLLVLKSFIKNLLITKSVDRSCDLFNGQATRPYRSIARHLVLINRRVTSSDASLPILPKMALAALYKELLAYSRAHLSVLDCTMKIHRYLISSVYGKTWPDKVVILAHSTSQRGPICIQQDFLQLIVISSQINSRSQRWTSFSKSMTEGDNSKMSSAYATRWLYCVECPQCSTRRGSAYNIHRSGILRKNR